MVVTIKKQAEKKKQEIVETMRAKKFGFIDNEDKFIEEFKKDAKENPEKFEK